MSTMTPKSMFLNFVDWIYDVIWCRAIFQCTFIYVIVLKVVITSCSCSLTLRLK